MLIRTKILMAPEGEVVGGGSTPAPAAPVAPSAPASGTSTSVDSSAAPAVGADQQGTIEEFDFEALAKYHAEGGEAEPLTTENIEPAAPAPVATPATPAAAPAPPAPVVTPAAPAASPPSPEPPAVPPVAATAAQPASPEPQAPQPVDWAKHRETFLPKLQEMYKLSEQEVQDFQTNPGEAIPKLAAEMHYKVMMALHASVMELVPQMLQSEMRQQTLRTQHEDTFYGRWPQLKEAKAKDPQKVEATINEAIRAYRVANPKVTMAELVEKVGFLAMMTLGIPPTALSPQAPPAPAAPPSIPGRPPGVGVTGHVPVRPAGQVEPTTEADFYGGLADYHLNGGQ
jgi:hypothetical protein